MTEQEKINVFLSGTSFAVVGASQDRSKYGNKVLRSYLQNDRKVYPVNPKVKEVEGLTTYPDLVSLPERVHGVSIVTPPAITGSVVEQAAQSQIQYLWMQPGAESAAAVERAEALGINVIAGGACILVVQGYHE